MSAHKDPKTGKWFVRYWYKDWQGDRRRSTRRGFKTKREAEEWLRTFLQTQQADLNMKLEDYVKLYYEDMQLHIKEHTMKTKKYIIDLKIVKTLGHLKMNGITVADIRKWQNNLIKQGYSPTYQRTIQAQLNAIFSHAVRYHELKSNPRTEPT